MPDETIMDQLSGDNSSNSSSKSHQSNDPTYSKRQSTFSNQSEIDYLKSIDTTLKDLLKMSQADAKNARPQRGVDTRNRRNSWAPVNSRYGRPSGNRYSSARNFASRGAANSKQDFLDGLGSSLIEGVLGSDFKDKIKGSLNEFANALGYDLKDIPNALGKEFGNMLLRDFKSSKLGKDAFRKVDEIKNSAASWLGNKVQAYAKKRGSYSDGTESVVKNATESATQAAAKASTNKAEKDSEDLAKKVSDLSVQSMTVTADQLTVIAQGQSDENPTSAESDLSGGGNLQDLADSAEANVTDNVPESVDKSLASISPDSPQATQGSSAPDFFEMIGGDSDTPLMDIAGELLGGIKDKALGFVKDKLLGGLVGKGGTLGKIAGSLLGSSSTTAMTTAGTAAAGTASTTLATTGTTAMTTAGTGTAAAGATAAGTALSSAIPPLLIFMAAIIAVTKVMEALGPAIAGAQNLFDKMGAAADRYAASRREYTKLAQQRIKDDIEAVITEPFDILKDAAQEVYDAWDKNVRLINGTQGYSKSDLQDLMSSYAERIRDEGLTSVVSSTDITESLAQVLDSGLSGKVAEEFAYQATKLNAAIPTQDFFGYASTYASLAANAIKNGQSEAEAIAYANQELELFASNVLYASRQLSGGFTTGLKDAQSLFDDAVQIAQASKTGDPAEIAGVLTAVSAITGAIAPDLASSITDAVVAAATGGNSSEIVALRSLAGINASNTEFLTALAKDPQSVFSELFYNLGKMQNMSDDAYMEVAEGLSQIFGLSMDAFARVDFAYLADAISNMNVSNASLNENYDLLASGETTLTAEQMRFRQINEYMFDEGLAYVLDNEVARSIQEHMWDEQLKQELIEATYGVELQGAALEFLQGIRETVDNIINLLNPISWFSKIANLVGTGTEVVAQEADLRELLELGKVGNGNPESLYQLTTRGVNLNLTPDLLTLMGGTSAYEAVSNGRQIASGIFNLHNVITDAVGSSLAQSVATYQFANNYNQSEGRDITSKYTWGTLGKSTASAILGDGSATGSNIGSISSTISASTAAAQSAVNANLDKMLSDEYIDKYIDEGKSYEDWAASAENYHINDIEQALEDAGYTVEDVKARFQSGQVDRGNEMQLETYMDEKDFRDKGRQFWIDELNYTMQLVDLLTGTNARLDTIISQFSDFHEKWDIFRKEFTWTSFYADWVDYFINRTVYNKSYDYSSVNKVLQDEKKSSEDAIAALVEAFRNTTTDLKDPTLQTNVLLAEILAVVNAIMQQNNEPSSEGFSLIDTFSALSTGLISGTT